MDKFKDNAAFSKKKEKKKTSIFKIYWLSLLSISLEIIFFVSVI